MAMDAEVVVVGGGLVGCAVALHLSQRGHEVVILERAAGPTDKVCGEGLLPHGVAALSRLGLQPPPQSLPFGGITWRVDGLAARGSFSGGPGRGVRRRDLDASLLEAARQARHVEVRQGIVATGLQRRGERLVVQTRSGEVTGRLVVGADGLRSGMRRWAGLEGPRRGRLRYGVRGHAQLRPGVPDPDHVEVELLDGFEIYLTPVGPGQVNVAALCEAEAAQGLKGDVRGALARWVARSEVGARLQGPPEQVAATGPMRQQARSVVADGVVLVGDAAGFLDGITGEGMSTGLLSAEIAAGVISSALAAGRTDARALAPYAARRRQVVRSTDWLAEVILWGLPRRWLVRRAVQQLVRFPALFDRLLALESGALA
jgi:flavin-dependent dehydrogenase